MLGLVVDDLAPPACQPPSISLNITPGHITLITGPSGSGKSTLLHDAAAHAREHDRSVITPPHTLPRRPCIDQFGRCSTLDAMRALARAGLADARVFLQRPAELSEGQRARLRIAITLHRAGRTPGVIILDSFAEALDRHTASTLAHLIRRAITPTSDCCALIATTRDDLTAALAPATHLHFNSAGALERPRTLACAPPPIRVEPVSTETYRTLAHFHYRPEHPAVIEHALGAFEHDTSTLCGVLTISRPTLNLARRAQAWPGDYDTADRRANARCINRDLRCISRVIVDPRFRGRGVARRLVRAYLDDPVTLRTEALAAMGAACPFFHRAGMTPFQPTHAPQHAALRAYLRDCGIEPWRLALPRDSLRRALDASSEQTLRSRLETWANASRSTRRHRSSDLAALFRVACRTLLSRPMYYAHPVTQDDST
jgi:ABC-type lipoprotein export system ATPase subunit/GNAT superfamily N-acetyltransferase